ncbi:MAG: hypothetical protein VKP72_13780 [bacterium]|nr:hypothetical protein [bacterium]
MTELTWAPPDTLVQSQQLIARREPFALDFSGKMGQTLARNYGEDILDHVFESSMYTTALPMSTIVIQGLIQLAVENRYTVRGTGKNLDGYRMSFTPPEG